MKYFYFTNNLFLYASSVWGDTQSGSHNSTTTTTTTTISPNINNTDNSSLVMPPTASSSPTVSLHMNYREHRNATTDLEVTRIPKIYGDHNGGDENVVIPVLAVISIILLVLLVPTVIALTYFYNKSKRLLIKDQS